MTTLYLDLETYSATPIKNGVHRYAEDAKILLLAWAIRRGLRPQTSPLPLTREVNMRNPFSFAPFPSWRRVFEDKSKAAQRAVYLDRAFRDQFREDLKRPLTFGNWSRVRV